RQHIYLLPTLRSSDLTGKNSNLADQRKQIGRRLLTLVGARGFEPPTSRSQTERTTRLCYAPCFLASFLMRPDILAITRTRGQGSDRKSTRLNSSHSQS